MCQRGTSNNNINDAYAQITAEMENAMVTTTSTIATSAGAVMVSEAAAELMTRQSDDNHSILHDNNVDNSNNTNNNNNGEERISNSSNSNRNNNSLSSSSRAYNTNLNSNNNNMPLGHMNGFHNYNGFAVPAGANSLSEANPNDMSMAGSNGDLGVCNQALANLRVYQFEPDDEIEPSNSNYNVDNDDAGGIGHHYHTRNNPSFMRRAVTRHRSGRRTRREKQNMRRSLKSMNNFLRKTVNTLKRIKSLILQQVQIARELHVEGQSSM